MKHRVSNAFTLAEVLITLGIIGVVAAMTMPTLINRTNGAQYKAAFKKTLSAISQGVTMSVAQDDISFADNTSSGRIASIDFSQGITTSAILYNKMKVVDVQAVSNMMSEHPEYSPAYPNSIDSGMDFPTVDTYLFFADGSMFAFGNQLGYRGNCSWGINICAGYIDVNGFKGPNKIVICDNISNTKPDTRTDGIISRDGTACTVKNPTDIYPVYYYDQTIVPSTNAGRAVLYGK